MSSDSYDFSVSAACPENDQRGEFRLAGRVRVRIELQSAGPDLADQSEYLDGVTYDVSPGGLRLGVSEPLTEGAILPVMVTLPGQGAFNLMAEVVWCRPSGGHWQAGLQLLESDETGFADWMESVARAMDGS